MVMFCWFLWDLLVKLFIWGLLMNVVFVFFVICICGLLILCLVFGDLGKFVLLFGVFKIMNWLWIYFILLFKMFCCGEIGLVCFGEVFIVLSLLLDLFVIFKEFFVIFCFFFCCLFLWLLCGCLCVFLFIIVDDSFMVLLLFFGIGCVWFVFCFLFIFKLLFDFLVLGLIIINFLVILFILMFLYIWKI